MQASERIETPLILVGEIGLPDEMKRNFQCLTDLLADFTAASAVLILSERHGALEVVSRSEQTSDRHVNRCRVLLARSAAEDGKIREADDGTWVCYGQPVQRATGEPFGFIAVLNRVDHALSSAGRELLEKSGCRVQRMLSSFPERLEVPSVMIGARDGILSALKACYQKLFNEVTDGMLLIDVENGRVLGHNRAFSQLTGLNHVEMLSDLKEMFPSVEDYDVLSGTAQIRGMGTEIPMFEAQIEHVAGALMDVEIRSGFMDCEGTRLLQLVFRDTSEMKRVEHHFRQSHAMNTMGQVAAGISHDLSTVVDGIRLTSELLMAQADDYDERVKHYIQVVAASTEQASVLSGKLRALGRTAGSTAAVLDLHEMIDDTLLMLPYTLGHRVRVSLEAKAEEPLIFGDAAQIQSALMNLCINADHAMPGGGALRIETRNVILEKEKARVGGFPLAAGTYLQMTVEDNGCGMDPETQKRVFESFESSTDGGRKADDGLGMMMVHRIMKNHHGAVALTSEPGVGTRFFLFFPLEDSALGGHDEVYEVGEGDDTILLCI
ncbi:ATP-binding protein [Desulfoluna sp.]|uniref:two-component system sensor histidine kinase NtrB n=1 Tax=Desulfoluna sp. TaxID=2045199 RepID=UPI00260E5CC6|nr:ATP-binding protein [Desulfoluna sp.]